MKFTLLIIALLYTANIFAATINSLRSTYFQPEVVSSLSIDSETRLSALISILQVNDTIANIETLDLKNTTKRSYSSQSLRKMLSPAMSALNEDAVYGAPLVFDPSDYEYNVEQKKLEHIYSICHKALQPLNYKVPMAFGLEKNVSHYEALFNSYYSSKLLKYIEKQKRSKKVVPEENKKLISFLINQINLVNNSSAEENYSINDALGKISTVAVRDGSLKKIYFIDRSKKLITISLESLVSYKTASDAQYINANKCFLKYIQDQLQTNNLINFVFGSFSKKDLIKAYSWLLEDIKGAELIHHKMSLLTDRQINHLLYLFLKLRQDELPTIKDVVLAQNLYSSHSSDKAADIANQFNNYFDLHASLSHVEEFIKQKNANDAVTKTIIENLKRGE